MLAPALPPLTEWESFYVITGTGAATLTGLMFVVVTLTLEARGATGAGGVSAFGTPTVVHFCAVLLVSAILTAPGHSIRSLGLCLGASGLAGLAYEGIVMVRMRRQKDYTPVTSDLVWHALLPTLAYACLLGAAVVIWSRPVPALYAVAAVSVFLLYIGIHNAWDAATWAAVDRPSS
ncbi:MAG: hypothetical protein ACJ79S_06445 [Gemmatimonadaceae bacterium]